MKIHWHRNIQKNVENFVLYNVANYECQELLEHGIVVFLTYTINILEQNRVGLTWFYLQIKTTIFLIW